jgi:hypothetical protein
MSRFLRTVRLYAPGVGLLMGIGLAQIAMAAPGTTVQTPTCTFSTGWSDGLSQWLFGVSATLMLLAAIIGGLQVRASAAGNGGSEHVTGAFSGMAGIGLILGLVSVSGVFAAVAAVSAGRTACP